MIYLCRCQDNAARPCIGILVRQDPHHDVFRCPACRQYVAVNRKEPLCPSLPPSSSSPTLPTSPIVAGSSSIDAGPSCAFMGSTLATP